MYKKQGRRYGFTPYAAVCYFHRQAGRPNSRNYLEIGGIKGNMRVKKNDAIGQKEKNFEQLREM